MSKKDQSLYQYLTEEVFVGMEGITSKRMFGGYGFYQHGVIFGIIADGNLYFKVGEGNREDFELYGSKPFTFPMKSGKTTTISYWEVPADIVEDRERLAEWIDKAVTESLKKKAKTR